MSIRRHRFALLLSAAAGLGAAASSASAQDIELGAYEELFGEPVTDSATGKPLRESESPVTIAIVSRDEIEASAAVDIAGLLRHVVGLSVVQRAIGQIDIGVRGFNQPKPRGLLVLVNGRQVYLDSYGSTDWEAIPVQIEEIRQIEVIRGPNGALYGFNAAQGVINIVTDNPLYERESFAVAQTGTQSFNRIAGGFSAPIGDAGGFRITLGNEQSDEFDEGYPSVSAVDTGRERITANADGALRLGESLTGRLELGYSEIEHAEVGPLFGLEDNDLRTEAVKLELSRALDVGYLTATAYLNTLEDGPVENEVSVAQLEHLRILNPRHTVRLSGELRENATRQRGTGIEFGVDYNVLSGALMWDWSATDRLTLVNAVRFDDLSLGAGMPPPPGSPYAQSDYDRGFSETSFNSSAVWQATALDRFRATAARGVQIPSLIDLGMAAGIPDGMGGTALFIGGDPSNDVTTVWNYELGWRRPVTRLGAAFEAVLFHTRREAVIGAPGFLPDALAPGPVFLFTNRGDTEANGVELSLTGSVGDAWSWSANYANTDVTDDLDVPIQAFSPVEFEGAQPRHVANGVVSYEAGRLLATLAGHYQSESAELALTPSGFQPQPIDAFLDLEARFDITLTDTAAISVSGLNLLDEAERQSSLGEVERRLFVALRIAR